MDLVQITPLKVPALSRGCIKFAIEAVERAQADDRLICLQAQKTNNGLKLAYALSVCREQAEQLNSDVALYREPSEYLKELRGNDYDYRNEKAI